MQHESIEAGVRDEKVAATTQHEETQLALRGEVDCGLNIGFGRRLGKPSGRPADFEGGERCQRDVLPKLHGGRVHDASRARIQHFLWNAPPAIAAVTTAFTARPYPVVALPAEPFAIRYGVPAWGLGAILSKRG